MKAEAEKKGTWGGSRGGGRPRNTKPAAPSTTTIRISQAAREKLAQLAGDKSTLAEALDELLFRTK